MRPSFLSAKTKEDKELSYSQFEPVKGCPSGMIPIMKMKSYKQEVNDSEFDIASYADTGMYPRHHVS